MLKQCIAVKVSRQIAVKGYGDQERHACGSAQMARTGTFIGMRFKRGNIIAMAGRDAGPYHNVLAAGTRARHVYSHECELVSSAHIAGDIDDLVFS